ncbi:fimbrial protein [Hydrogenophaga crassostreae]|uniref:Fimbrial protein n=1 Tax=Hydrogenophaga crassostreae TaxID=1763535 RepID=A0A167HEH0_9BURK|nr:PilN domain-containing protein [Hydrogenophaga crassostreae]AOW12123.1 fimbrial protein [Hydrogenophaga crassostreae]OAD41068.1 fimbrial protein [Hydrogenophaga crassostreae]
MILINLLPHREAARERQKKQFYTQLVLSMLLGAAIAGGVFMWFDAKISEQQDRNNLLKKQMAILDTEIKDIAGLQAEIASLRARQTAVENLQADRNMPVHLINEVVSRLPEGIYLRSMKQENQNVLLSGVAQSQERVSELLRNLASQSDLWLGSPELVEIVASNANVSEREQRRVSNFTVRVVLKRPAEREKSDETSEKATALSKKV